MIFNISGGGGTALNFKVVTYATKGTMLAATPSENTIGIITDTPMTSWIFASEVPNPAVNGMVWILTSTSSDMEFNALKKNNIQLYPISAKQYVNGAWVDKDAASYQGAVWVDWWVWDGETLYGNGDESTPITGGFTSYPYKITNEYGGVNVTSLVNNGSTLNATFTTTTSYRSTFIAPVNLIDLTGYSTLEVNVTGKSGDGSNFVMAPQVYNAEGVRVAEGTNFYDAATRTLDISALNDNYRVGLMIWRAGSGTVTVNIGHIKIKK